MGRAEDYARDRMRQRVHHPQAPRKGKSEKNYWVTLVVEHLGWVELDLGSSPGVWAAALATYCPSRVVEYL